MSYLEDIKTLITAETNKYMGSIPDIPDNCIGIFPTGGKIPVSDLSGILQYREPYFQVIIRDDCYALGASRGIAILELLTGKPFTVGGVKYSFFAKSDLFDLGRDSKFRSQFSVNFEVMII